MRDSSPEIPMPWERVLWRARPSSLRRRSAGERYVLTDLRLAIVRRNHVHEIALGDIGEVERSQSAIERFGGVSTLIVHTKRGRQTPLVLTAIRRATPLAALLELLSGDPRANADADGLRAALAWTPRPPAGAFRG